MRQLRWRICAHVLTHAHHLPSLCPCTPLPPIRAVGARVKRPHSCCASSAAALWRWSSCRRRCRLCWEVNGQGCCQVAPSQRPLLDPIRSTWSAQSIKQR